MMLPGADGSKMRVNVSDYLMFPVFLIGILISTSLLNSTIAGFDLASALWESGSHSLTIANLLAIAALGYVAYSNDWDMAMLSAVQFWLIIVTVGLLVAPPFVPLLQEFVTEQPANMVAAVIQIGGYMTFSYVG